MQSQRSALRSSTYSSDGSDQSLLKNGYLNFRGSGSKWSFLSTEEETSSAPLSASRHRLFSRRSPRLVDNEEEENPVDAAIESIWLSGRKHNLFKAFLNEFTKKHVSVSTANGWPSQAKTLKDAVSILARELRFGAGKQGSPTWIFVACNEALDPEELMKELQDIFPDTPCLHGVSSCQGVMTEAGFKAIQCEDGITRALALFAMFDPLGSYLTVGCQFDSNIADTLDDAYKGLRSQALDICKLPDLDQAETPGLEPLSENMFIWLSGLPGLEDTLLEDLSSWSQSRFGRIVPVLGGTGADDAIEGNWFNFCQESNGDHKIHKNAEGVIITLISASVKVFPLFMHPFSPVPEFRATVTACGTTDDMTRGETSGRVIHSLRDAHSGKEYAAGSLYYSWCKRHLRDKVIPPPERAPGPTAFNKEVLQASTHCPLGVLVGMEGDDASDYRMIHPSGIYFFNDVQEDRRDCYLKCFAAVEAHTSEVVLMRATRGDLLHKVGKMKEQLVQQLDHSIGSGDRSVALSPDSFHANIAGVLMVYCGGKMMALNSGKNGSEQMRRLTKSLSNVYAGRPFLASFPFGEQGYHPAKQRNGHGNLMLSAMVFSKESAFDFNESWSFSEAIGPILKDFTRHEKRKDMVCQVLTNLLVNGDNTKFEALGQLVATNTVSSKFLQSITPCTVRPLSFALRSAKMLHDLSLQHPLHAKHYGKTADWFKRFCAELVQSATMHQLAAGKVFDHQTLSLSVHMAVTTNATQMLAEDHFQELMEHIWLFSPDIDKVLDVILLHEGIDSEHASFPPWLRHRLNIISYILLISLQFITSMFWPNSLAIWLLILCWSFSHVVQTVAHFQMNWYILTSDLIIVTCHITICVMLNQRHQLPRDLDCISMFFQFANLLHMLIIFPSLGSLIIMVLKMAKDIRQFFSLLIFFFIALYGVFHALMRGANADFVGENYHGPATVLINAIWGSNILWETDITGVKDSLFLSTILPIDETIGTTTYLRAFMFFSVFLIPILLLNLLIAIMAGSYEQICRDVDVEYKQYFASTVLEARELPLVPMPLSLPQNFYRWCRKILRNCCGKSYDKADGVLSEMESAQVQTAVEQMVSTWEAQMSVKWLERSMNLDHAERASLQNSALMERVNLLYTTVSRLTDNMTLLEQRLCESGDMVEKRFTIDSNCKTRLFL